VSSSVRVIIVRRKKLVAEAGDSSGTQRKDTSVVGSHYQTTASEDLEDFMCAIVTVIFVVCNSVRLS
jgi:hypothetical protein